MVKKEWAAAGALGNITVKFLTNQKSSCWWIYHQQKYDFMASPVGGKRDYQTTGKVGKENKKKPMNV